MPKKVNIELTACFTPKGKHTCMSDYQSGDSCEMLGSKHFGTVFVCMFSGDKVYHDGGFLSPCKGCPVAKALKDGEESEEHF